MIFRSIGNFRPNNQRRNASFCPARNSASRSNPASLPELFQKQSNDSMKAVHRSLTVVHMYRLLQMSLVPADFTEAGILKAVANPEGDFGAKLFLQGLKFSFTHLRWLIKTGSLLTRMR